MSAARKAVIFDWNGTVLDDTLPCLFATNMTLKYFGVNEITLETYRAGYTVPIDAAYKTFGMTDQQLTDHSDKLVEEWGKHYEQACETLELRHGAVEAFDYIKEAGHKLAVLSNYTVDKIAAQAARFSVQDYFHEVLGNDHLGLAMRQGKGDRLKAYVETHDIEHAIIVGDTVEEVEIARAYGFASVAITEGSHSENKLRASNPDYMIDTLTELKSITRDVFGEGGAK